MRFRVWDTCRLRYRYQYLEPDVKSRLRPSDTAGTLLHRVLCDFFSKVPMAERSGEKLVQMFEDGWRALSPRYLRMPGVEAHREAALRQLRNFAGRFDLKAQPYAVEAYFQTEVTPGVILFGRIDRIDEEPDLSLHVIDYKGGEAPEEIDPKQLVLYAILAERETGRTVSKASFWFLEDGRIWTLELSAEEKAAAWARVVADAEEMERATEFPPTIGPHCAHCPYLHACEFREEIAARRGREGW